VNVLSKYLKTLRDDYALGTVAETSHYAALKELLSTVGLGLSPKVRCVLHPKGADAGIADAGLFTLDQLPADGVPVAGALPQRGVVEAKGVGDGMEKILASPQVAKYLARYGRVFVTNLREFAVVTPAGVGERFSLASSPQVFWYEIDDSDHDDFVDFLKRALLGDAKLTNSKDVAWLLASHAKEARRKLETGDLEALNPLKEALETALGITFDGEKGRHLFRSTLVQTLFYGVFSAWVLWVKKNPTGGEFDWKSAAWELRVPVVSALFEQIAQASRLKALGLVEPLERAGAALNRVDREAFFTGFAGDDAVQYFYEPFLEAFDPELRRQFGVWYTPREIVRYQVAKVDALLKSELGVKSGLADPSVVVLDPCCGTGAYLIETLKFIHGSLVASGADADDLEKLRKAARERLFGFELLPAPFVVAHLQLALLLESLGAPLQPTERAGVYLTNALTGWEGEPPQKSLQFPQFGDETDAAQRVKRQETILVILGNPPYSGFAGLAIDEERSLSDAYRTVIEGSGVPRPQGQGLNDLYVRFFRMAERRIVEGTGRGIVCFISNYSWLDGLSFPGMRQRYLSAFDKIYVDSGNGDKYRTGKKTPDGKPDPSLFSTPFNREGIQVGTAIATLVRKSPHVEGAQIFWREFWGTDKLKQIEAAKDNKSGPEYQQITPAKELGLPFSQATIEADYLTWPKITELFPSSFPGVQTKRDEFLIDIDLTSLQNRIRLYFDKNISNESLNKITPGIMSPSNRYTPVEIRNHLIERGIIETQFVKYFYRPFDVRWIYWEKETKLLGEKSPLFFPETTYENEWIESRQKLSDNTFDRGMYTKSLADNLGNGFSSFFAIRVKTTALEESDGEGWRWNLSDLAREYLVSLDAPLDSLFFHALATLHAPAYRAENAGALRQDWPRVPLPKSAEALRKSAALGRRVAALLDSETEVPGVTDGELPPALRGTTLTVYLNATTAWTNVPESVWNYTLGGYQVLKKWLSYREEKVLGRPLTTDETRHFRNTVRRIAALLLLAEELDESYR
jgi:hypothetical protein